MDTKRGCGQDDVLHGYALRRAARPGINTITANQQRANPWQVSNPLEIAQKGSR